MRTRMGIAAVAVGSVLAPVMRAQSANSAGPVSFELSEMRSRPGRAPTMRFVYQTVEIHQCATLETPVRVNGSAIVLGPFSLNALKGPCPPTVTPAFGARTVALTNGRYSLTVVNADTGTYEVDVNDSLISVSAVRAAHGATARYGSVLRIQANTFALTCGSPREDPKFCPVIVSTLAGASGIMPVSLPAGAHGWQPQANGFWVNEPTRYFRYATEAALMNAESILTASAISVPKDAGFGLAIAVSDGRDFFAPPGG